MKRLRWFAVTALTSITFLTYPSLSQDAYTIAERVVGVDIGFVSYSATYSYNPFAAKVTQI